MSRLRLQSQAVLAGVVTEASWRTIPSTYVVLTEDLAIPEAMQRAFAAQATDTVVLDTSHSPMLSRPAQLAAILSTTSHVARTATA